MIKKFRAPTTREALRLVRDALGANAIILSNRQVGGEVEIIAAADLDVAALAGQAEPALRVQAKRAPNTPEARTTYSSGGQNRGNDPAAYGQDRPYEDRANATTYSSFTAQQPADSAPPKVTPFKEYLAQREASVIRSARVARANGGSGHDHAQPASAPAPDSAAQAADLRAATEALVREIRALRNLVEGQLAGFAWGEIAGREPVRAEAMKRLLSAGFGTALSRQLLANLPSGLDVEHAIKWLKSVIAHKVSTPGDGEDILERGGVYALVGPTGVGKTTTVAKLAARAVLRFGAGKVALVTTDAYRIGALDQLRIYGRILGTPVFAVQDENDFGLTLSDLKRKHLVLIDTVGMSQRDKRVAEQVALLCGEGYEVQRLLLISAPSQGMTLEEVVRAYSGPGLIGCILTKIDEALSFGPSLDVIIRHQLKVYYVTNGQRVPEDLHVANALYLVDRAFRLAQIDSPYSPAEGDYPVLAAAMDSIALPNDSLDPGVVGALR